MMNDGVATHSFFSPRGRVPDDVVASLVAGPEHLRYHHIILRQPELQLLVPSPVAIMPRTGKELINARLACLGGGEEERRGGGRLSTHSSYAASCCFTSFGQEKKIHLRVSSLELVI